MPAAVVDQRPLTLQRLKQWQMKRAAIPHLDEFKTNDLYSHALKVPEIAYFLPDRKRKRPVNRQFFFDVRSPRSSRSPSAVRSLRPSALTSSARPSTMHTRSAPSPKRASPMRWKSAQTCCLKSEASPLRPVVGTVGNDPS